MKSIRFDRNFFDVNYTYPVEWFRDIIGYKGLYKVSNYGRIISVERLKYGGPLGYTKLKRKIIAQIIGKGKLAYCSVQLWKNNKRRKFHAHRLVAIHFLKGEPRDTVNHKDGDKTNNIVTNLEWATYSENNQHAHDIGLINPCHGVAHPVAKLTDDKVRHIRKLLASGMSQRKVAGFMGVSRGSIQKIAERTGWKHVN